MNNEIQREFFRRYLTAMGAESALQFIYAVNEVKMCKDAKMKNSKISQITRKYFTDQATGALPCFCSLTASTNSVVPIYTGIRPI